MAKRQQQDRGLPGETLKELADREAKKAEQDGTTGPDAGTEAPQGDPNPAEPGTTGPDPETTGAEIPDVEQDDRGPLSKLQDSLRELLDFDQLSEIRLALGERRAEIEKHGKKGRDLGIYEPEIQRRLVMLDGSDMRFGLIRIFAPLQASESRDLFYDREKPNGRPDAAAAEDETITFRAVDGRDITCLFDQLEDDYKIRLELHALYRAGTLPDHVKKAIQDGDFWHVFQDEEADRALAEAGGVEA